MFFHPSEDDRDTGNHANSSSSSHVGPLVDFYLGGGWKQWTPSTTAQPEAIQSLNLEPPPGVNADPEAQRLEISSSSGSLSDSDLLAACEELESSNSLAEKAKPSSTSPTKGWWPSAGVDGTERFPPRSIPITDEPSLPHMPETKRPPEVICN